MKYTHNHVRKLMFIKHTGSQLHVNPQNEVQSESISLLAVEFEVPVAAKRYTAAVMATARRVPQRF